MNTGFSWVRIDKGNIHCNFRYLNKDQVDTVINYLLSYYEYRNVTANVVDLGASGVLQESGDHYRPSDDDPALDYYYLVELHRHGTIIPQGCVEIIKTALNSMSQHQIIPESVFISRLKNNQLTVNDEVTLTATSTKSIGSGVTWASSDTDVITISPDGLDCDITAVLPGTADISASVEVAEDAPMKLKVMPIPSQYWVGPVYQYIGATHTTKFNGKKYGSDIPGRTIDVTFTQDEYYECVYDNTAPANYIWRVSSYEPGTPVMVTYRDIYTLLVKTYVEIITKNVQRMCLYSFQQMEAYTPSVGLTISWNTSADNLAFDGGISTGNQVTIEAKRTGTSILTASISDAYGVYDDSVPITVYAIAVTPKTLKMVTGAKKSAYVRKKDIFHLNPDPGIVVEWVTSNAAIASLEETNPSDPTTDFAEVFINAQGVGQAFVTAIAEDPTDGTSYSDALKVTVGNVAINVPESTVISLISGTPTLTLTCELTPGFEIMEDAAWQSANPNVVEVTSVSGASRNTVTLTGLAKGSSTISVQARYGSAIDTDTILITVDDAEVVTGGEMASFTHGLYNNHGYVDWEQPTGEEGTMVVDGSGLDLATQQEVEGFVDDLFVPENDPEPTEDPELVDPESEDPESNDDTTGDDTNSDDNDD